MIPSRKTHCQKTTKTPKETVDFSGIEPSSLKENSVKKDICYIKLTKCGSSSINRWLQTIDKSFYFIRHRPSRDLSNIEVLEKSDFIFSVARNPYSRAVSSWAFLEGGRRDKEDKPRLSFKEFMENDIYITHFRDVHTKSQYELLKPFLHFNNFHLGKLEEIDITLSLICEKFNLNKSDFSFPQIRSSKHDDYKSYYNDEIQELVYNKFKKDFLFFGYSENL
jgi:hypothetical protein